jgi:hypothetical protein
MERDVANIEGLFVEEIELDRFCGGFRSGIGLDADPRTRPSLRFKYTVLSINSEQKKGITLNLSARRWSKISPPLIFSPPPKGSRLFCLQDSQSSLLRIVYLGLDGI